jgi:hypothetical protein
MRSQAQQEEDDIETAIRLSILEAEEQSKRLQMEQDALSSLSSPLVSASQTDTWQMELEAARQREQQVRYGQVFAFAGEFFMLFCCTGFTVICSSAAAGCWQDGYRPRVLRIIGFGSNRFVGCRDFIAHFATAA